MFYLTCKNFSMNTYNNTLFSEVYRTSCIRCWGWHFIISRICSIIFKFICSRTHCFLPPLLFFMREPKMSFAVVCFIKKIVTCLCSLFIHRCIRTVEQILLKDISYNLHWILLTKGNCQAQEYGWFRNTSPLPFLWTVI